MGNTSYFTSWPLINFCSEASVGESDFKRQAQHYRAAEDRMCSHHLHVEFATLEWVDWFNNRRLLEPIGHIPPVEFEQLYYQHQGTQAMVA